MISGTRVAERLKACGLSQGELARRVGVSQPTIFKLIHENKSGSRILHKVARELRTTPAYLNSETDDPAENAALDEFTAEERDWVELLRAMPPKERAAALTLVRTIATSSQSPSVHG